MDEAPDKYRPPVRSYVLRTTRMSRLQRRSYEQLLPLYSIPYAGRVIDPQEIFPGADEFIAEIGFGMGEATVSLAERNPNTGYFGIEVHKPGVGKLLSEIDRRGLENLRVINHDAVEVFRDMIPPESLSGIHIFFPDPWPKKRHHKRRLIQAPFLRLIFPALRPQGYLYICTDWEEYADEILSVCGATPGLHNEYRDFASPQPWRPGTKFEMKGKEKSHPIREILFRKSP
jgi:tRNA (guanine-N7-)-methyltransferase